MLREIDTIQEEMKYISIKFPSKNNLIDVRVRVNIPKLLRIVVVMKCFYGLNLYRER